MIAGNGEAGGVCAGLGDGDGIGAICRQDWQRCVLRHDLGAGSAPRPMPV
jgi:hypothetical protein